MLIQPKNWERHGLKPWIEAAKKRLHHNVLAIALANKLARCDTRPHRASGHGKKNSRRAYQVCIARNS
jgi:hypothetical protein